MSGDRGVPFPGARSDGKESGDRRRPGKTQENDDHLKTASNVPLDLRGHTYVVGLKLPHHEKLIFE